MRRPAEVPISISRKWLARPTARPANTATQRTLKNERRCPTAELVSVISICMPIPLFWFALHRQLAALESATRLQFLCLLEMPLQSGQHARGKLPEFLIRATAGL